MHNKYEKSSISTTNGPMRALAYREIDMQNSQLIK